MIVDRLLPAAPFGSAKRSWPRSLAKSVTWRLFAMIDTFAISVVVTGSAKWAGSIVSVELLTKTALYYLHERAWARARIGIDGATAMRRPAHEPLPRRDLDAFRRRERTFAPSARSSHKRTARPGSAESGDRSNAGAVMRHCRLPARAENTRPVYFAFHFRRDIWRVDQVRQHWLAKGTREAAGFFDGSLEEKAQTEGVGIVKSLIDEGMRGAAVTCVLIGAKTYTRRWVDYEILKSVERGMGVFGVYIHELEDDQRKTDSPGSNPFYYLGYVGKNGLLQPRIRCMTGWFDAKFNGPISASAAPYLDNDRGLVLNEIFKVYDWHADDGHNKFADWVAAAAKQAGR